MKPDERLKEIEELYNRTGEHNCGDIDWLIARVKRLTEALKEIARPKASVSSELELRWGYESIARITLEEDT